MRPETFYAVVSDDGICAINNFPLVAKGDDLLPAFKKFVDDMKVRMPKKGVHIATYKFEGVFYEGNKGS